VLAGQLLERPSTWHAATSAFGGRSARRPGFSPVAMYVVPAGLESCGLLRAFYGDCAIRFSVLQMIPFGSSTVLRLDPY
jgi:hypothetical protein